MPHLFDSPPREADTADTEDLFKNSSRGAELSARYELRSK